MHMAHKCTLESDMLCVKLINTHVLYVIHKCRRLAFCDIDRERARHRCPKSRVPQMHTRYTEICNPNCIGTGIALISPPTTIILCLNSAFRNEFEFIMLQNYFWCERMRIHWSGTRLEGGPPKWLNHSAWRDAATALARANWLRVH